MSQIEFPLPGLTDRTVIMGQTGSGKTVLGEVLCRFRPYVVAHDAKGMLEWPGYNRHTELATLCKDKHPKLIYAPNHQELASEEIQGNFFQWIYERRNTTLYVDEVYAVMFGTRIPHYYRACLTRGRQMGISVISSTQRPKRIAMEILSESEHYYVFRLLMPEDRARVKEILPLDPERIARLKKFRFLYGSADGDIINRPMKLVLPTV